MHIQWITAQCECVFSVCRRDSQHRCRGSESSSTTWWRRRVCSQSCPRCLGRICRYLECKQASRVSSCVIRIMREPKGADSRGGGGGGAHRCAKVTLIRYGLTADVSGYLGGCQNCYIAYILARWKTLLWSFIWVRLTFSSCSIIPEKFIFATIAWFLIFLQFNIKYVTKKFFLPLDELFYFSFIQNIYLHVVRS